MLDKQTYLPENLRAAVLQALYSSGIGPETCLKVERGVAITRGELREVLELGNSVEWQRVVDQTGIATIQTYEEFAAKLSALIGTAQGMSPAHAYTFVKDLVGNTRLALDVDYLAHAYIAIGTTTDTSDEVMGSQEFNRRLSLATCDKTLQLPGHSDFPPRSDREGIEEYLMILRSLNGRKQEAVTGGYKNALLLKLLVSRLTDATKEQIGVDFFTGLPIVYQDTSSYQEALRYARPLPIGMQSWVDHGLRDTYIPDYDHLSFYTSVERMCAIVGVVMPDGIKNPFYQAYAAAFVAWKLPTATLEDERVFHIALQSLQKELYKRSIRLFKDCYEPLHPQVEIPARNVAWYLLTTGEGCKTSPYWAQMHKLQVSGHIDADQSPALSSSVETLQQIARAEGIDLALIKACIGAQLQRDLTRGKITQAAIADLVLEAFMAQRKGENPLTLAQTGEENWYITTALFGTTDKQEKNKYDGGSLRRYGVVLELAEFIRQFSTE